MTMKQSILQGPGPESAAKRIQSQLVALFARRYGTSPSFLVRAPGRVNLIGGHTDYHEGFVLPAALDRAVWLAARPRPDRQVHFYAADLDRTLVFDLRQIEREAIPPALRYLPGVAWALQERGLVLDGMEAVAMGNLPMAAGLSSSAAIEVAAAYAFQRISGFHLDPREMALTCQRAEREFVGMPCGVMDQMVAILGKADHALFIDCRDLTTRPVPLPAGLRLVIVDSGVQRELVNSAYATRQAEGFQAARHLGARVLRDVTPEQLEAARDELPPHIYRRARHVITENRRVLAMVEALERGDLEAVRQLMTASHASLRDDYEVSCPELEALVEIARAQPGVVAARLTGAGWGGCTVNLVWEEAVPAFVPAVVSAYQERTGRVARAHICRAADGVTLYAASR